MARLGIIVIKVYYDKSSKKICVSGNAYSIKGYLMDEHEPLGKYTWDDDLKVWFKYFPNGATEFDLIEAKNLVLFYSDNSEKISNWTANSSELQTAFSVSIALSRIQVYFLNNAIIEPNDIFIEKCNLIGLTDENSIPNLNRFILGAIHEKVYLGFEFSCKRKETKLLCTHKFVRAINIVDLILNYNHAVYQFSYSRLGKEPEYKHLFNPIGLNNAFTQIIKDEYKNLHKIKDVLYL